MNFQRYLPAVTYLSVCAIALHAQQKPIVQQGRLRTAINSNQRTTLAGHVHPMVNANSDRGAVASSFLLPSITIYFKPSPAQNTALETLLADQQNPNSPRYRQWLTPEQFADSFGARQSDYDQVSEWLKSQGFTLASATRSRRWITMQATAAQVENTFKTSIHRYQVNGKLHYANTTEPTIPVALAGLLANIRGLHDFGRQPRLAKSPLYNFSNGTHALSPDDFATIYNVAPLYAAGIDGTGQKLAIVGQTAILASDIQRFRTRFNLPSQTVQEVLVPGQADPGIVTGDIDEANLDLQWAGAVARNAALIYVYSGDVQTSIDYVVDQNLAPVFSASYGVCEPADLIDAPSVQATARQANAQGQTWLNAAGDAGATDCDIPFYGAVAQAGLAVDSPANTPEVTAIGGTQFNDNSSTYWAATNDANFASALSYIPESAWNTSSADGFLAAGGGGTSIFFAKPIWQTGPGVPSSAFRHLPDLSLNSSGNTPAYVISQGSPGYYYGTSFATPTMAGIIALLNQYLVSSGALKQPGLGNINPALYRLAQSSPDVFHDVVDGANAVPCASGSPDCENGRLGFAAGAGYDRATGLGSVDANAFVHKWANSPPAQSQVVPSIDQIPVFQNSTTKQWTFTLTLQEEAGIATTLTGFSIDGKSYDLAASFPATAIPAGGFISGRLLSLSGIAIPKMVLFTFTGVDANGRAWSQDFSVPFRAPMVKISVAGVRNAASGEQTFAPGELISVYGAQFGDFTQAATALPLPWYLAGFEALIDGVSAPLYFVSPGQVNIQIPYETLSGTSTLIVGNSYDSATFSLRISSAAPGIFASSSGVAVPFPSVARGQTTTLFMTGEGRVRPALNTGETPNPTTPLSNLPKPQLAQSMTIGGQPATIAFIGIPTGLVGVTQVNFTVPTTAPLGLQPVVVTIGGVASPPVNITVTE
jgi:uncharacterized protein (TIGR03437 family)